MISGGEWMGGVGAMQAVVMPAAGMPVVAEPEIADRQSFAEVMRGENRAQDEAGAKPGSQRGVDIDSLDGSQNVQADQGAGVSSTASSVVTATAPSTDEVRVKVGFEGPKDGKVVAVAMVGKLPEVVDGKTKAAEVAKLVKHAAAKVGGAAVSKGDGGDAAVGDIAAAQSVGAPAAQVGQAEAVSVAKDKDGEKAVEAKPVPEIATGNAASAESAATADSRTASSVENVTAVGVASVSAGVQGGVAESGIGVGMQASMTVQGVGMQGSLVGRKVHEGVSRAGMGNAALPQEEPGELTLRTYEAATPNKLEVGLQGGEFGWLKVRAEMGADGGVNAFLRGASAGSAEALQTQAPRIEAYLGTQDVAVRGVHVEAAMSWLHGSSTAMGDSCAGGGTSQQEQRRNGGVLQEFGSTGVSESAAGGIFLPPMMAVSSGVGFTGTGSWLSVRV